MTNQNNILEGLVDEFVSLDLQRGDIQKLQRKRMAGVSWLDTLEQHAGFDRVTSRPLGGGGHSFFESQ